MGNMYDKICTLCKEKGIKPGTACREIGISRSVITDMKAGRTKELSVKNASLFAEYFGISLSELIGENNESKDKNQELNEYLEILRKRPECRTLFQLIKGSSKEDIELIIRIIKALRNK